MKDIPKFTSYFATKKGDIVSYKRNRKHHLKPHVGHFGYKQVILCRNNKIHGRLVHRLILETFVGPCPDGMQCRHLDGNKLNNNLDNLCWGTRHDNQMDRKKHGTFIFTHGEEHYMAKLTESQVNKIRQLSKLGYKQHEIAKIFSICRQTVSQIVLRKSWKCIKE